MEDIKKFLRLMDYESLLDLCASMLFERLVTVATLIDDIARLDGKDES